MIWTTSFRRGAAGEFDGEGANAPFTPAKGLRKAGRAKKGVTGTRIRYWADRQVFTRDATFNYDELVTRARQTSFLVPGLELVIRDERGDEPTEETSSTTAGSASSASSSPPTRR